MKSWCILKEFGSCQVQKHKITKDPKLLISHLSRIWVLNLKPDSGLGRILSFRMNVDLWRRLISGNLIWLNALNASVTWENCSTTSILCKKQLGLSFKFTNCGHMYFSLDPDDSTLQLYLWISISISERSRPYLYPGFVWHYTGLWWTWWQTLPSPAIIIINKIIYKFINVYTNISQQSCKSHNFSIPISNISFHSGTNCSNISTESEIGY